MKKVIEFHRWIGWFLTPCLLVSCITGTILMWLQPLPKNAPLRSNYELVANILDNSLLTLTAEDTRLKWSYIDLPRDAEVIRIRFSAVNEGESGYWASIDSGTGKLISMVSDNDNLQAWLFNLHHEWFLGETGSWPVGLVGLLGLTSIFLGFKIWFFLRKSKPKNLNRRWHRRIGIITFPAILIIFFSGFALSWPEAIRAPISWATGQPRFKAPITKMDALDSAEITPGVAIKIGINQIHNAIPTRIYPAKAGVYRLRLRADELHPNGLNSVYINSSNGEVIKTIGWKELPLSSRYTNLIYPFHIGRPFNNIDANYVILLQIFYSCVSLGIVMLIISGTFKFVINIKNR